MTPLMAAIDRSSFIARMQSANKLLQTFKAGKPALGAWQMLPGANVTRVLARSSQHISWIVIDQEHGNISDDGMHASVVAAAHCGVSPIVRVPDAQHWMIKRALDAGAHGVVIPLVKDAAQAREIVSWTKFPPTGTRGFGSPFPMECFGQVSQLEYLHQANEATLVILQIETSTALQEVEEIAAIDGVDVVFVGPFDLGNNIGHPIVAATRAPELDAAIEKCRKAALAAGKQSGIYAVNGQQAKDFVEQGFTMVTCQNDVPSLQGAVGGAIDLAATAKQ